MEISTGMTMGMLQEASKDARVVAAQQQVDHWKGMIDKVDLSLASDREHRSQLEPKLYEQTWAAKSHEVAQFVPLPFIMGMGGSLLAVSAAANAIPALAPFKGVLALGTLVAYWKLVPELVGKVVRKKVIPPLVDKAMKQELQQQRSTYDRQLGFAQAAKDRTLQTVTTALYKKAEEEQAARGPSEVHVADEFVIVNGIRVPRKREDAQPPADPAPASPPA